MPPCPASVGIQPNHVAEAAAGDWDEVVRLADDPRVVALGETGLDRYWDYTPFPQQEDYFARHLELRAGTGQGRGHPLPRGGGGHGADAARALRAARPGPRRDALVHRRPGDGAGVPGAWGCTFRSPAW